jgi:hypothetical protein
MVGELIIDCVRRSVVQGVFKYGAGDPGVFVVKRDEGVPSDEGDVEWNGLIGESDFGKGKLAAKIAFLESWEAFEASAPEALALKSLVKDFECGEGTFDELRDGRRALDMQNGETSLGRVSAEAGGQCSGFGTGVNGEVLKAAVSIDANAARAEAADGHCNLGCPVAVEGALRSCLREL